MDLGKRHIKRVSLRIGNIVCSYNCFKYAYNIGNLIFASLKRHQKGSRWANHQSDDGFLLSFKHMHQFERMRFWHAIYILFVTSQPWFFTGTFSVTCERRTWSLFNFPNTGIWCKTLTHFVLGFSPYFLQNVKKKKNV